MFFVLLSRGIQFGKRGFVIDFRFVGDLLECDSTLQAGAAEIRPKRVAAHRSAR